MAKPEILSEHPITLIELKQEMEKIKARDKELTLRSNKTEEYLNQFAKLAPKKAEELKSKLESLNITRLKEEFVVKIIDTLPATVNELKTLLQGYIVSLNQKDMEKVIEVVKGYIPKK